MAFGFSALNDNGLNIIDGELHNYKVVQSGSFNQPPSTMKISFTADAGQMLLFISPPTTDYFQVYVTSNTFEIDYNGPTPITPGLYKYFICVPIISKSNDSFGLEIVNPSGVTIIDSGYEVTGIDGAIVLSTKTLTNSVYLLNVPAPPAGRSRYALANNVPRCPYVSDVDSYDNSGYFFCAVAVLSPTQVAYKHYSYYDYGGTSYWQKVIYLGASAYR